MSAGSVSYGLWFKTYGGDRSYMKVQKTIVFNRGVFLGFNKHQKNFAYVSHFLPHFLEDIAR